MATCPTVPSGTIVNPPIVGDPADPNFGYSQAEIDAMFANYVWPETGWARQDSFFGAKTLTATDLGSMILTVTGGTVTMFDPSGLSGRIGINVGSGTLNIDRNGQAVGGDEGTTAPDISALPTGLYILEIVSGGWTLHGYTQATLNSFLHEDTNGAVTVGDRGGDPRGANAINIQPSRSLSSRVAAGANAVAIGSNSWVLNDDGVGVGGVTVIGLRGVAMGSGAAVLGDDGVSLGSSTTAGAAEALALGYGSLASALGASALGHFVKTLIASTAEFGFWSDSSTRGASVRPHGATGMVGFTIQDRAAAYTDGGATAGSEADNTVMRGGYAIRRDGDDIYLDLNIAGTIKTLSLGTAT